MSIFFDFSPPARHIFPMAFIPRSIAASVQNIAKQSLGKDWQIYGILLEYWPEIVGPEWADAIVPVKISFPHFKTAKGGNLREGTLTLRLPRGMAMEAQYRQQQILDRINIYLGLGAITKIVFAHAHASKTQRQFAPAPVSEEKKHAVQARVVAIEDEELRNALQTLGEIMLMESQS